MNKLKYFLALTVVLFSALITVLNPFIANASTIYDDVVQLTNELPVHNSSLCSGNFNIADLTKNWSEVLVEPTTYNSNTTGYLGDDETGYPFSWNSGTVSGGGSTRAYWSEAEYWSLTTVTDWSSGYSYVYVTFTNDPNATIEFRTSGGDRQMYYNVDYGSGYWSKVVAYSIYYWPTNWAWNATGTSGCGIVVSDAVDSPVIVSEGSTNYVYFAYGDFVPPSGYEGITPPDSGGGSKQNVYPGMSVIVEDNGLDSDTSKVTLQFADSWLDWLSQKGLSNEPYYSIFTLTDMEDNIIPFDGLCGRAACTWNSLPLGDYKARLNTLFTNTDVTDIYDFKTTEVWFKVNNTSYTMLYNPNEGKYCTVRNGYEWNCSIPQPGDDPTIIDGEPEEWIPEECTLPDFPWINLGACIRNALHYLGEYLGINGPSITTSSTPFFQFDTNTFGLTSILTAPLTILNSLQNAEYLCVTVQLPMPFVNTNLPLPCMQSYYSTYMGDLYAIWQTVINGLVAYYVVAGMLRMVKEAKDPQKDQIEVLKL